MADFFKHILNFMGPLTAAGGPAFLLCLCGEILLASVPYLLETVWLMAGYSVAAGTLSPFHLFLLWLIACGQRSWGIIAFQRYQTCSLPLTKLYQKYVEPG